jgi:uncharacterized protein (TIGR00369 family)
VSEKGGGRASDHAELDRWFRNHWDDGVAFNKHAGIRVQRWEADGVELTLPFKPELSAHEGIFHGGVLAALIDTTGSAATLAGHDFAKGSRLSTISMTVSYLATAPFEDVLAVGHATRRGRQIHHAEVWVKSTSGKLLAQGLVVVSIGGVRPGLPGPALSGPAVPGGDRPSNTDSGKE